MGACRGKYGSQGTLNITLTDGLFVSKVRIVSGSANGLGILGDFALYLSPGPLGSDRAPRTPVTLEVRGNRDAFLELDAFSGEQRSAAIQIAIAEHEQPVTVREVLVFGEGPASDAVYTSDIIDYGRPAVWGSLRWGIRETAGSRVHLVTRGGSGGDLLRYWKYTGVADQRVEVTRAEYEALRSTLRAGTTYNYDGWTVWSPQTDLADTAAAPPMPIAPVQSLQLQVEFSTSGHEASSLEFLEFRASVPAVSRVVGELDPVVVTPGEVTDFTYTLRPRVGPTDTGFDRIQIRAVAAQLDSVLGVAVDDFDVPYTVESLAAEGLVVGLPRVTLDQADAPVQVRFRARALRYGAAFAGHLLDSERPYDAAQPIPPGDAVDRVYSDRLWIETRIAVTSVLAAVASPATITPNGDGVNDEARIAYDIFETTGTVPVSLVVHDLTGRRVRDLHAGAEAIGHYERVWDGRDDAGRRVPPGLYLFRAAVRLNGGDVDRLGVIHVAY